MKAKVSDKITKKDLENLKQQTIGRMQEYISSHQGCSVLDMVFKKKITTMSFISNHVVCTHCGHIEEKASYAIAQRAMGHTVAFACNCGNKFNV